MSGGCHADALRVLDGWTAPAGSPDPAGQLALRDAYAGHLRAHPDGLRRSCPQHLTASALVLDGAGRVLLTLHPKVGRWLQLGGHLEPADATLADGALREAAEESGIDGLVPLGNGAPVRLDRHDVRCGPGGRLATHLDVQYALLAPAGAVEVRSEESLDLRWWPVDALPDDADGSVRALVSAAGGAGTR